jgi:hypothetical protein
MDQQTQFAMGALLEKAGFRIRGRGRADCIYCEGGSNGTVSFTDEVCFCHRCHWKSNVRLLARELGLLSDDPEARRRFAEQERQRQERESVIKEFEIWLSECQKALTTQHRELFQAAGIGDRLLIENPADEIGWAALADYYHQEARLSGALDRLACAKATPWNDQDTTIIELFTEWQGITTC